MQRPGGETELRAFFTHMRVMFLRSELEFISAPYTLMMMTILRKRTLHQEEVRSDPSNTSKGFVMLLFKICLKFTSFFCKAKLPLKS